MHMDDKKHYVQYIETNPLVVSAFNSASSDEERERIKSLASSLGEQIGESFIRIIDLIKNDENIMNQLRDSLVGKK